MEQNNESNLLKFNKNPDNKLINNLNSEMIIDDKDFDKVIKMPSKK